MSLFKNFFGTGNDSSDEEQESEFNTSPVDSAPADEKFTFNFKKNGGKFLYCENLDEVREQFENILEENDWFESEVVCYEPKLYTLLDENKLTYENPKNPKFLFASCENLIADEGAVLFSSNQIKQNKPNDLPDNIVILATTSQILENKSDGLQVIKKNTIKNIQLILLPLNILKKQKKKIFFTMEVLLKTYTFCF